MLNDPVKLARLGLAVELVTSQNMRVFWLFRSLATGRDIGSWVPHTGSARVGREMKRATTEAGAVRLYARHVRGITKGRSV